MPRRRPEGAVAPRRPKGAVALGTSIGLRFKWVKVTKCHAEGQKALLRPEGQNLLLYAERLGFEPWVPEGSTA